MPSPPSPPTHREVLIVGRPGGGAADRVTGERAHGGVCFYDGGHEFRHQPGDVVEVPVRVAADLLREGLAVVPGEEPDEEEVVEATEAADSDDGPDDDDPADALPLPETDSEIDEAA